MSDLSLAGGVIRKLWSGDRDLYRDHLLRLDPASRRSRFSGGVSDDFVRNYVELSHNLGSVLHGFFADGGLRGVGELRPLSERHEAEAALSIERSWQNHGVGSALLKRLCCPPATAASRGCIWHALSTTSRCCTWWASSAPSFRSTSAASMVSSWLRIRLCCRCCANPMPTRSGSPPRRSICSSDCSVRRDGPAPMLHYPGA